MNTKRIFAAVTVSTALAIITPAYAGALGGGIGGGMGGGLGGMNRLGGLSSQGALQGQGAFGGSFDKPKLHPAVDVAKHASTATDTAAAAGSTQSKAAASKPAATSTASNTASNANSATQAPQSRPSLIGAGTVDAQHSSDGTSLNAAGASSASATRN